MYVCILPSTSNVGSPASVEFREIVELCEVVTSLTVVTGVTVQPHRRKDGIAMSSSTVTGAQVERRARLLSDAILFWLLGSGRSSASSSAGSGLSSLANRMPRSISAGLSAPLCYALLSSANSLHDTESVFRMVQLLEGTVWSVIQFGKRHDWLTRCFVDIFEQDKHVTSL